MARKPYQAPAIINDGAHHMNNALTQLEAIELAKVSIAYQRYIIRFLWVMLAVHVFEVTVDLYPYIERLF